MVVVVVVVVVMVVAVDDVAPHLLVAISIERPCQDRGCVDWFEPR
jgi:hypothetical protein